MKGPFLTLDEREGPLIKGDLLAAVTREPKGDLGPVPMPGAAE